MISLEAMSVLCQGEEKRFFLNNEFSLYNLYGHAPAQEPLPRGSWNLQFWYNLPWSSLLNTSLSLCGPCTRVKKTFLKNYIKITTPKEGRGSWNLQFLVSLPWRSSLDWSSSSGEDVKARRTTDDGRLTTTPTHSNRSLDWLRWPSKDIFKKISSHKYLLHRFTFFMIDQRETRGRERETRERETKSLKFVLYTASFRTFMQFSKHFRVTPWPHLFETFSGSAPVQFSLLFCKLILLWTDLILLKYSEALYKRWRFCGEEYK